MTRLKDSPNEMNSERCGGDTEREEDRRRVRDSSNGDDKQEDVGKWTMHLIQEKEKIEN